MPSKSARAGMGMIDDSQRQPNHNPHILCNVTKCNKPRCKTCAHSNVTGRNYDVINNEPTMTCESSNIIYLISCCKFGIQYIGEASQMLRQRMNNHRNRLQHLGEQYLYQHFCCDGHDINELCIIPIEKVVNKEDDSISFTSERLQKEQHWYRELNSIYPYRLNDNVKSVGNMSNHPNTNLVMWNLFNHHTRRYRKRPPKSVNCELAWLQ